METCRKNLEKKGIQEKFIYKRTLVPVKFEGLWNHSHDSFATLLTQAVQRWSISPLLYKKQDPLTNGWACCWRRIFTTSNGVTKIIWFGKQQFFFTNDLMILVFTLLCWWICCWRRTLTTSIGVTKRKNLLPTEVINTKCTKICKSPKCFTSHL